jgi:hypothetical protein
VAFVVNVLQDGLLADSQHLAYLGILKTFPGVRVQGPFKAVNQLLRLAHFLK